MRLVAQGDFARCSQLRIFQRCAAQCAKAVTDLVAPLSDADLWRVAQFVAGEIRRRDKDFGPPIMVRRP